MTQQSVSPIPTEPSRNQNEKQSGNQQINSSDFGAFLSIFWTVDFICITSACLKKAVCEIICSPNSGNVEELLCFHAFSGAAASISGRYGIGRHCKCAGDEQQRSLEGDPTAAQFRVRHARDPCRGAQVPSTVETEAEPKRLLVPNFSGAVPQGEGHGGQKAPLL